MDLLPTLCHLAGISLPENEIDGENVWDLISGVDGAKNPHSYYAFSNSIDFEGVMSGDGKWKLHLPHVYRTLDSAGMDGFAGRYVMEKIDTALFNMEADPYESTNVLNEYPEIASELILIADQHREKFYRE